MSVVNRMLQDIDARRAGAGDEPHERHPDIRSVPVRGKPKPSRPAPMAWALAALVLVAAGAYWATRSEPRALPVAPAAKLAAASAPAQPVPVEPARQQPVRTEPAQAEPAQAEPAPRAPVVAFDTTLREMPRPREAPPRTPVEAFRLTHQLSAQLPAPAVAARPAEVRRTEVPVRRVAPDETVAAAHALWSEGARADAIATLREALAAAEGARNAAAARRLARELARLEVAADHPQGALELLRRMEASLSEDADAWALRGNAAQRLALHGEAAQSYLAAVRLRPDEGKWMLGAAISLAAEGRAEEARPWVERARDRGAVTPAIDSYLQQLGLRGRH